MSDTHLILTIISGNQEEAINIIKNGDSHPEVVNAYGDTALLLSIHYSMEELALEILDTNNANPGHIDHHKNSALILAIKKNLPNVAYKIVTSYNSYSINHQDANFDNALSMSIRMNMFDVSNKLIDNPECNISQIDKHGDTPLLIAIDIINIQIIKRLILNEKSILSYINKLYV
jgi:ankyrin repeat protein